MKELELYHLETDSTKYLFHVRLNTIEPCSECGVPACGCGREDILWYEKEGQKIAIVYDGSFFDWTLGEYFENNIHQSNYASSPEFLQEWNEDKGWADTFEETIINKTDFLNMLTLIDPALNTWTPEACLTEMKKLVEEAIELGLELRLIRG
ncbi:MAG: hypothetical protein AB8F95_13655 [Bacteroidia bacterium]